MTAKREVPGLTVLVCGVAATGAAAVGIAAGSWRAGLAVALGLVVGSFNGLLAKRALRAEVGFGFTSVGRLMLLSAIGLGIAATLGLQLAPLVLAGIGAAQLVLAGISGVLAVRA